MATEHAKRQRDSKEGGGASAMSVCRTFLHAVNANTWKLVADSAPRLRYELAWQLLPHERQWSSSRSLPTSASGVVQNTTRSEDRHGRCQIGSCCSHTRTKSRARCLCHSSSSRSSVRESQLDRATSSCNSPPMTVCTSLSGTIPSQLGALTALAQSLFLGQTSLSGTIPSQLGALTMLAQNLDLAKSWVFIMWPAGRGGLGVGRGGDRKGGPNLRGWR